MPNWMNSKDIRQALSKKWDKGVILRSALENNGFFPFRINLHYPKSDDMINHLSDVIDWKKEILQNAKSQIGYGYQIVEKERAFQLTGKNLIPTHAVINGLDDAIKLLHKQKELSAFKANSEMLIGAWDLLRDWVLKYPFKVIDLGCDCEKVLMVLKWFSEHQDRSFYLRQLDIEGIDTKFIESRKGVISELLDIILPADQVNFNTRIFEERYGLKSKPQMIRFRILDKEWQLNHLMDLTAPIEEFEAWSPDIPLFFFTENEVNFLSFPDVQNACIIFGKGYGVNILKSISWLCNKEVYYWGDIDTHGFNILSDVRSFLPQIKSFLMTEEILLAHQSLWSEEKKQVLFDISRLDETESELVFKLQHENWGRGVRLEQERVRYKYVNQFLDNLFNNG